MKEPYQGTGEGGFAGLVYIRKSGIGERIVVLLYFLFYQEYKLGALAGLAQ